MEPTWTERETDLMFQEWMSHILFNEQESSVAFLILIKNGRGNSVQFGKYQEHDTGCRIVIFCT